MVRTSVRAVTCLLMITALFSCTKDEADSSDGAEAISNISESAMAEAGQQSTASEGASSPSFTSGEGLSTDFQLMDFLDPQDALRPLSACTFSAARSTCSSNVSTISWGGCTIGTVTLTGGWSEAWSAGFCSDGSQPTALTNGTSVTRTSPSGQVLTFASGATLTTDTVAHTTYDGTSIPGTGITISNSGGTRTVVINGLHKVLVGPRGRTWFNHTLTSSGLTVTGTRSGGNRVVSGTSVHYHNLAEYKATHTFTTVTWRASTCCYPTSGSVSSTLEGSRSGTVSLSFTTTCGEANFTDTDASVSSVTLSQCN
ncbi:MAG: hypothetical protein IPJ71_06475 [Bdellovibrionales bacterium]|nr:hypothetical protein [Bdellovibrionales bacterium]